MDIQQIFTFVFGAIVILVPLFALFKCVQNPQIKVVHKMIWAVGIIVIPVFGGLVYLLLNEVNLNR